MYYYIVGNKIVVMSNELDSNNYNYSQLTASQITFYEANKPNVTLSEVLNEELNDSSGPISEPVIDLTNLTIDGSLGLYFNIVLDTSQGFVLNNIAPGLVYTFFINNTSASAINIVLPDTVNDLKPTPTIEIAAGKYREIALYINDKGKRIWIYTEELS